MINNINTVKIQLDNNSAILQNNSVFSSRVNLLTQYLLHLVHNKVHNCSIR